MRREHDIIGLCGQVLCAVTLALAAGCVSFHGGYSTGSSREATQRIEILKSVHDVTLEAAVRKGRIVASCTALAENRVVDRETKTLNRKERRLSVGVVPGMRRELEIGSSAGWYPFEAVLMNVVLLGLPTFSSLFIVPFNSYEQKPILMAEMGLVGASRYTVPATPQVSVRDTEVQAGPEARRPLAGIKVSCHVLEDGFQGEGVTDKKGECVFHHALPAGRASTVILSVMEVGSEVDGRQVACRGLSRRCVLAPSP